jgi:hypothetical protein
MPGPNKLYTYKQDDDPLTVASQFGISPNQLLSANPGGTPFSIGQSINIPFQYKAPIGPQPAPTGPRPVAGPQAPYGPRPPTIQPPPAGYGPNYAPTAITPNFGFSPTATTRNILYRTARGEKVPMSPERQAALENILGLPQTNQGAGTGTGGTPGPGQFYGYVENPETGRSERVIKNSSESSFLNEKRWDPQAKKYVSIGKLLKQGKLDLKGNWSNKSKRQKRNESNSRQQQAQKKIDFTLANSLISFGGGSG